MHGIVSLLPEPYYSRVFSIWDELETRYRLNGIRATPYPHFSWQIGQHYPAQELKRAMQSIAAETAPLKISTAGLGVFTGRSPVLYIPVVKTAALDALHIRIWERFTTFGEGISSDYSPMAWMPHISLAYLDLTAANIGPVLADLTQHYFTWDMYIDNIAFIYQPSGKTGQLRLSVAFQNARI
jgi:2'-5' RNA ligase